MTQNKWIPTPIESLRVFDVIHHAHSIWVIQRIYRHVEDGQTFNVTRVDDGKQSEWKFSTFNFGYLIERLER